MWPGRQHNRIAAYLQRILAPWALPPCKNAVNMAVARGIVNMQSIGLAALYGAPSGDLEAPKHFYKKASPLRSCFLGRVLPSLDVATAPCKNAGIRAGDPLRSTL